MLKQTSSKLCGVIYLKEEEAVLYNHLINRKVCLKCNQSFNNTVELCPDCNIETAKRDDEEILIISKRIQNQKQLLQDVVDYYIKIDKLLELDKLNLKDIYEEVQKIYMK